MPRTSGSSTSVDRVLSILETLAIESSMSNADLSRALNMPKSSASQILRKLEDHRYILRDDSSGRYRLSSKVLTLSQGAMRRVELRKLAVPVLDRLTRLTRLGACIAVLDGAEIVFVHKVDGPFMKLDNWLPPRIEVHACAAGKALMAYLPKTETRSVLERHGMRSWTPNTITSEPRFFHHLLETKFQGFATDHEEYAQGLHCVAAPIFGAFGHIEACLGVAGPADQLDNDRLPLVGRLVQESAHLLSEQLGFLPKVPAVGSAQS